jgi:hypothetical protein
MCVHVCVHVCVSVSPPPRRPHVLNLSLSSASTPGAEAKLLLTTPTSIWSCAVSKSFFKLKNKTKQNKTLYFVCIGL